MKIYDCIIIGGGASGIFAAYAASFKQKDILLLEKKNELGKKLQITGKGRCNLSNSANLPDFIKSFYNGGKFLYQTFNTFFTTELTELLEKINIPTVIERGGRIFPKHTNGIGVCKALTTLLKSSNINIEYNSNVTKINKTENVFTVTVNGNKKYFCTKLVIATGGASYPKTGSTGFGFKVAKQFGHNIANIKPALVPLVIDKNLLDNLLNLELRNVKASLYVNNKKVQSSLGEVHFKKWGLTGPLILTYSSKIVNALDENKKCSIFIDLKPGLSFEKLENKLLKEFASTKKIGVVLKTLLPSALIKICLQQNSFNFSKIVNQISKKERKKLVTWLKEFKIEIKDYKNISEAIITQGGVNFKQINPYTMESKIIKNLYFCGEVINIDAKTGGYNLMAAFSCGYSCGINLFNDAQNNNLA